MPRVKNYKKIFKTVSIVIRELLVVAIFGLRPWLGPAACRFPVSCTSYAIEQLKADQSFIIACFNIISRLLSCNPLADILLWLRLIKHK